MFLNAWQHAAKCRGSVDVTELSQKMPVTNDMKKEKLDQFLIY